MTTTEQPPMTTRRHHVRVSPPVDPRAVIDEVAIEYVMSGKRPFSILHWEEELVVWDRWWSVQTSRKPDPAFYKIFGIDMQHSRLLAGASRTEDGKKLLRRDRRHRPK